MQMPTPAASRSVLLKFKIADILPPSDPMTPPLLRLMIAMDDLRHLQKLLVLTREWNDSATESDKLIRNGEIGHLFRLLSGHLYEAITPFRVVDGASAGRLDQAVADDPEGEAALAALRSAFDPNQTMGVRHSFLYLIRNKLAFHYRDEALRASFAKHLPEGHLDNTVVMAESLGLSRHSLTDSLVTFTIADSMGETFSDFAEKFMERIGEAIKLVGELDIVVSHLLAFLFAPHQASIEAREDSVTIPPQLREARDAVERERRRER